MENENHLERYMQSSKAVFVYGSNKQGRHGKGAALTAVRCYGAKYGRGFGLEGRSFGVPTRDLKPGVMARTLQLQEIKEFVDVFKAIALVHPDLVFFVTRLGCGLAGYADEDVAALFVGSPRNCFFDPIWHTCYKELPAWSDSNVKTEEEPRAKAS